MPDLLNVLDALRTNASAEALGHVILRATAPVFLLTAVASFINVLTGRLARIVDRIRSINRDGDENPARLFLKSDLPRLKRRSRLVHRAIFLALLSGIATTLIVVVMFGGAFIGIEHEWGAALLFILAQVLFAASLVCFAMELRISLTDFDNYE